MMLTWVIVCSLEYLSIFGAIARPPRNRVVNISQLLCEKIRSNRKGWRICLVARIRKRTDKEARVQKDSIRFYPHAAPLAYELRLRSKLATEKVGVGAVAGAWDIE